MEQIERKLIDQQEEDEDQQQPLPGEKLPNSRCTDPSLPPLKKLKKSKSKKSKKQKNKLVEQDQEQPPGENSPDSIVTDASLPPLDPRYPLFPHGGSDQDFEDWAEEVERVKKLNAPRDNLPTHSPTECKCRKDPATLAAVVASDKMMLLSVADIVVSISFSCYDPRIYHGQDVNECCSGFIISWDKVNKKARILTCDYFVCNEADTMRKPYVRWPYMEDTILEGELLFFSKHYQIALLEIPVDLQFQIEIPPFGSYPKYGHEVFTLAREHKELSLMVRRGTVSRLQECLGLRHHFLFVDYELPDCGAGGPVVDRSGDVVGMSFYNTDGSSAILSISTALLCVNMWTKFGFVSPLPSDLSISTALMHRFVD